METLNDPHKESRINVHVDTYSLDENSQPLQRENSDLENYPYGLLCGVLDGRYTKNLASFFNGKCVAKGLLTEAQIQEIEAANRL